MANPFFNTCVQRDAYAALQLFLQIFDKICTLPTLNNTVLCNTFSDFLFAGVYKEEFSCTACGYNNVSFVIFRDFTIGPHENIGLLFQKINIQVKTYTCSMCKVQNKQKVTTTIHEYPKLLLILVNRFSISSFYHRHRKNNQPFHILDQIRFGLVDFNLMALIEHHGIDTRSGHYTCFVKNTTDWYYCNDNSISRRHLPKTSANSYLLFFVHS